jgi:hypothetical protein
MTSTEQLEKLMDDISDMVEERFPNAGYILTIEPGLASRFYVANMCPGCVRDTLTEMVKEMNDEGVTHDHEAFTAIH